MVDIIIAEIIKLKRYFIFWRTSPSNISYWCFPSINYINLWVFNKSRSKGWCIKKYFYDSSIFKENALWNINFIAGFPGAAVEKFALFTVQMMFPISLYIWQFFRLLLFLRYHFIFAFKFICCGCIHFHIRRQSFL